LVLVGDPRQLPEIDAGGAFRGLLDRHGDAGLFDNRRQHAPWERDALAELRHGNPNNAFESYVAHDRVHVGGHFDIRAQLINDWSKARTAGQQVLIVAPNLRAVDDLNRLARDYRQLTGELGRDRSWIGFRPYTEGDRVLALRNDYQVGILNGTLGTITSIDDDNKTINVRTDDQRSVAIPFDYAERNLSHGYATTIHKAQGTTVDRCFVYVDETTSREHTYTALSRGRDRNDLYINSHDSRADVRHGPELDPDTNQRVRTSLNRTISQLLATDQSGQRSRDTGMGLRR
jgi:ATP-dependent exoDNAse (exonuclease V) alpha subunit